MKHRIKKWICLLAMAALLCPLAAGLLPVGVSAEVKAPYTYSVDDVCGKHVSGTMIGVIRDITLPYGEKITAKGWIATPEGISGYQYLWVPVGGGAAEWQTVKDPVIVARGDLAAAGIPYPSGYGTAGFELTVQPPENIPEGYYDVYIRAIDGAGVACDMVALLSLCYGEVDYNDRLTHRINFSRLLREGNAALSGEATVTDSAITLGDGDLIRLGDLNLVVYEKLRITYEISPEGLSVGDGRRPILGLKSSGRYGYGKAGESYNLTDNLCYGALGATEGEGVLEMDLTDVAYGGEVWLSGYLGGRITVKSVELIYNGHSTDRVSAKIFLSEQLVGGYFGGANRTTLKGVSDPVLGEVLRMEVNEATNDPYVFFNAAALLEEHGLTLDASDYKYMVLLYRAEPGAPRNVGAFYLCAGSITNPTESCTKGLTWNDDGKWHYLLVDLTDKENWTGLINGWRFDYYNGDCNPGNAVEFASVQFFRTAEKAAEYAARDPLAADPFYAGSAPVLKDLCEDSDGGQFVIDPADSYVVTEPAEVPTTPAEPTPDTPDTPEAPTDDSVTTQGSDGKKGCASTLAVMTAILIPVAGAILVRKRKEQNA